MLVIATEPGLTATGMTTALAPPDHNLFASIESDDFKGPGELNVNSAAVVEGDFDLVVGLLVARLGR